MYPNFHNNEYVLTNLISLRFGEPKQGDVVVFKSPAEPEKDYIKRVIGVPGDRIYLKDAQIYLNGNKLDETYLPQDVKTFQGAFLQDGEEVTVPEGAYFVMGDNRGASSDSREWGFVKKESIVGVSMLVYLPLNRARAVGNPYSD
jgi:signal peptidase I